MSKILEMIKNEKVEWKKLGDVCEILDYKRKPITKSKRVLGEYPYYGANGIQDYVKDFIFDGTFILMGEDGSVINKNNTPVLHWVENSKIWVNNHAHVLGKLNSKYILRYIYYYLSTVDISSFVKGTPPKINQGNMKKIDIPIPSIETQEKIVEILDSFVKYGAELQAELQNRSSQYEYFRDLVLSKDYLIKLEEKIFYERNKNIEIYKIKDLCKRQRGIKITAKEMEKLNDENSPVKVFAGGNTIAKISKERVGKENIINEPSVIVKSRGNIDFEYYDKAFTHKNEMWSYSSKNENVLNIKFLYYLLKNNLGYFINNAISGKLPQISTGVTDNYKILLPSIEIQNKVVEVLDKFQNLISDAEGLLPEEIEQRQKQYEYYREKLLTFENNMVQVKSSQVK